MSNNQPHGDPESVDDAFRQPNNDLNPVFRKDWIYNPYNPLAMRMPLHPYGTDLEGDSMVTPETGLDFQPSTSSSEYQPTNYLPLDYRQLSTTTSDSDIHVTPFTGMKPHPPPAADLDIRRTAPPEYPGMPPTSSTSSVYGCASIVASQGGMDKASEEEADVVILDAGLNGLTLALALLRVRPTLRVRVYANRAPPSSSSSSSSSS
eukprot:CAMPEP_0175062758 /NCGR_PEP_ID=MMETSP0052_2-20121109/14352_1 /TAXON_ID=51329 ORGANISM="Polytomella parva, Strain SAG 63-3" /NCGR_SAMPLE_ID=MMETSP0052_2 /ASSEMBLY_ACC=CAM_ASM_000194 /LENGTH=205 /DNA_ID=CAMNT_0016328827 /DNA_START=292 /DNA_END=905 /DNA_ORIENTATION=-